MHLFKKSLTKVAILSVPFALAFTLSACDDSGTDSDGANTPGTSEGTGNDKTTENSERVKENPCDFDINDPEWTFSFLDVGGTRTMTFKFVDGKSYFKEVDINDEPHPCDVEDSTATYSNEYTISGWGRHCENGNMIFEDTTTYIGESVYTREDALRDAKNSCEDFTVEGPKNRAKYEELLKENEQASAE
jgi:hypothetical protein